MKIWKLFLIFFISYPVLIIIIPGIVFIIGFLFFYQDAPWCLKVIPTIILYPVRIVDMILSNFFSKQVNRYVIIIISSAIVAAFFTALFVAIKAVAKKL